VKVSATQWNGLSKEDREKVHAIISNTFAKERVEIVPDPHVVAAEDILGIGKTVCQVACSAAEAAAVAACAGTGPAAPVCIAAAHVAADACRNSC
jgi:hypothetical protein